MLLLRSIRRLAQSGIPPIRRFGRRFSLRQIHRDVQHVHGPAVPDLGLDEALVLCVVRNGEPWIQDFLRHYLDRGFRHIVLLDNGSMDATVDLARSDAVTMLRSELPFGRYSVLLRRYLIERFARGRWSLTVDIDELWDYPFSDHIELPALLRDLRERRLNAVLAHMLDLFAAEPPTQRLPLDAYRLYDLSHVTRDGLDCDRGFTYCGFEATVPGAVAQGIYRGGIRAQAFGLDSVWLTKMPLLFFDDELDPLLHPHFSNGGRIADFSTVLLHYKFVHTFPGQIKDALRHRQYFRGSREYASYDQAMAGGTWPSLLRPTTRTLVGVDQLVDEGFLSISNAYRELAAGSSS